MSGLVIWDESDLILIGVFIKEYVLPVQINIGLKLKYETDATINFALII